MTDILWSHPLLTAAALSTPLVLLLTYRRCSRALTRAQESWTLLGNDGLTNAEREQYAKRWREGAGAPFTAAEIAALRGRP